MFRLKVWFSIYIYIYICTHVCFSGLFFYTRERGVFLLGFGVLVNVFSDLHGLVYFKRGVFLVPVLMFCSFVRGVLSFG